MLTFMNSKLPHDCKYLTSNTTFSKKVNLMKYRIPTYILVRTQNLLIMYFAGVSNQIMKSILNVKKTSNLIKIISSYNICSGIKSKQAKKRFVIHYQKLDFFQNFSVPFHQVTFYYSISCVLLIDKPNKSFKNLKTFEIPYPPKKAFKKKRKQCYTRKDKCPNFTNFLRMPKINNLNLSNKKQKERKMKLGQLQEEIPKASLPVSAGLSNDFKLTTIN